MSYTFTYREYAEALYHALTEDAFYITMEKSVENGSGMEAMIRYMDYSILEAVQYGETYIPQEHNYGASVWSKPINRELEQEKSARKKAFLLDHMGNGSLATYNTIVHNMSEAAEELVDKNYWYLSILGILPKFQNKGLGAGLVKDILDKADKQGAPTFLETFTRRNITFYERLGYQIVRKIHEPATNADYWLMTRTPK